jgi:RNA polymerase sigma-70 factor (ECF subfamily)
MTTYREPQERVRRRRRALAEGHCRLLTSTNLLSIRDDAVVTDDLAAALARGEPSALRLVYEQHHEAVRAFARRLIGDAAVAEDLVHDTFVALPSAVKRFRGECPLRAFIVGVAANHARHHVRAAARSRAAVERLSREPSPAGAHPPDETLLRKELARALTRALDALPIEQRVVFVLCEVEARTSREVALIVGAPDPTVRARLRLAKEKLREHLSREGIR